jgi:hypothetical protein
MRLIRNIVAWLVSVCVLLSCTRPPRANDSELRKAFDSHQGDFARAVQLMRDTREMIAFTCDSVELPNRELVSHVEAIRLGYLSEYQSRELCAIVGRLQLPGAIGVSRQPEEVAFTYKRTGLVTGGEIVWIIYTKAMEGPFEESIDGQPQGARVVSKLSVPDWYLVRRVW